MRASHRVVVGAGLWAAIGLAAPTAHVRGEPQAADPDAPALGGEPDAPALAGDGPAWDRRIADFVSPGPLAGAHIELEGVTRCNDCHSWLGGTPDAACLACHEAIGERMAARAGYHGELEGSCATCHADHRGVDSDLLGLDRESFAHDQALFALRGAHAGLACDDCHLREDPETGRRAFHAIGVPRDCVGCHRSPHADRLVRERDCESCHVAAAWSAPVPTTPRAEAGFDHDADTRFALDPVHSRLECAACHAFGAASDARPGPPPPRECTACHGDAAALLAGRFGGREVEPDPHARTTTCRECHPAAMVLPSLAEYAVVCVSCHPASYAPLLAARRALLDEALVRARLATDRAGDRRRLERLTRSGLHHPELAEALALELARPPPR